MAALPELWEAVVGGERVHAIVGGAVLTQDFAAAIGAGGYNENASAAVAPARR